MPHATLKLIPGVDQNRTPALNEAALSESQLIRFVQDRQGLGLPQKLGGWTRYYPNALAATPRAMLAWQDNNGQQYLAVGCEAPASINIPPPGAPIYVINNGTARNLVPQVDRHDVAVDVTTTTTSNGVIIEDTASNMTDYNAVFVLTHISVGGVIIFGFYRTYQVSANTYEIFLTDVLGNPVIPTSAVSNGGLVAEFDVTNSSSVVTVTLNNHGYSVGDTYPVLVSTTLGGVTLFGNYTVTSIVSANEFTINAPQQATSTTSAFINGGDAAYDYYYGFGSLTSGTGYGVGGYGTGGYGSGVAIIPASGDELVATDWTLDNWGDTLIACPNGLTFGPAVSNPLGGPIYQWSPQVNSPTLDVIPEAPVANAGIFVAMPQRQIIAWGSTFNGVQDPLLIRWCDIENYQQWIALPTNQAGSYRIPKGSQIIGCIQGPQQGLVWTDLALWAMQYVGAPYVYSFNEIGTGCGLIAPKAAASLNGVIYWMSQSQFFMYANGGVQGIQCPIWDVIFQDLDTTNLDKIRIAVNSRFNEVAWFYPTMSNGGEINAYVKYNVGLNQWDFGTLSRTAWINQSVLGPPIGATPEGLIYQHETSQNADGFPMTSYFQTGYFTLSDGDVLTYIDQFWPDAKWGYYEGVQDANLLLTFYVLNYPGDTPKVYGPYDVVQTTQYIVPRFRGRLVSIKIESNDIDSFWRMGAMRYRFAPDGKF
jgi:hypothetical protein